MNFQQMNAAVDEAKQTLKTADYAVTDMSKMLVGRLRKVENNYQGAKALAALKKELSQYNVRTGEWKN